MLIRDLWRGRVKKNWLLFFALLFSFLITLLSSTSLATSWAYPFVVWDGYIYVVGDEYVTNVEDKIGEVTKYSDMEQYAGNFSNAYKEGTPYYSIPGVSTDEAIAVQDGEDKYRKAVRESAYTYTGYQGGSEGRSGFAGLLAGVVVLSFILFFLVYFVKGYVKHSKD